LALGKWTQRDPLGAGNPYAYTNCNPVNSTDPSGLISGGCAKSVFDLGVSVVGLGISIAAVPVAGPIPAIVVAGVVVSTIGAASGEVGVITGCP